MGILYICQFLTETLEEGFATSIPSNCNVIQDSGRKLVLCPTSNHADIVFQDIPNNLPGKYDNVCVGSGQFGTSYYTCYTRPGPPVFNYTYGIYRPFDQKVDDDTLPDDLIPSIDSFCASYNTNTLKVNRGIVSTANVLNAITAAVISTNIYQTELGVLKQIYCERNVSNNMIVPCSNINTAFRSLTDASLTSNIIAASNIVQNSLNTLSNISTKTYSIYNGSECQNINRYKI